MKFRNILRTAAAAVICATLVAPVFAGTVGVMDAGTVRMTLTDEPCGDPIMPTGWKLFTESREHGGKINGCWARYTDDEVTYHTFDPMKARGRYYSPVRRVSAKTITWTEEGATMRSEYPHKL
jgi:hypothetical protein